MGQRCRASKKTYVPDDVEFQTKPQIALGLIDRALANGVRVSAWTFDELYARDGRFLDGLETRKQVFVGEVPSDCRGWVEKPRLDRNGRNTVTKPGRRAKVPRVARRRRVSEVRNLLRWSSAFRYQSWQRYRIKDTGNGPEVWEVKWSVFWRRDEAGLPTRRHCLVVARNVLTEEVKYFLSNRVPGERNPATGAYVTLRWILRVAFGRWTIERCFREGKEELGLDHYQVRGWRCVHRHFYLTQLSHLFCARVRQEYDESSTDKADRITVEQIRSAMDAWLDTADLPPKARRVRLEKELRTQRYYQRRSRQARKSHTKTRHAKLEVAGIDVDRIKSCIPHT